MENYFFDRKVRKKFKGFSPEPPVGLWQKIDEGLNNKPVKRLFPLYLRIAVSAAVLVFGGLSVWYMLGDRSQEPVLTDLFVLPQSTVATVSYQATATPDLLKEREENLFAKVHNAESTQKQEKDRTLQEEESLLRSQRRSMLSFSSFDSHSLSIKSKTISLPESGEEPLSGGFSEILAEEILLASAIDQPAGDFSLSLHFAPQYNYRYLSPQGEFGFMNIPFQNLEEEINTYSFGVSGYFNISRRLAVQTGLHYLNIGQYVSDIMSFGHIHKQAIYELDTNRPFSHPQTIMTSQGTIRLSDASLYFADSQSFRVMTNKQALGFDDPKFLRQREKGLTQHFGYLEIPLVFRYMVFENLVGIHLKGGITGNYLVKNEVFLGRDTQQQPIGETHGLRNVNFSALGGFVMSLPISGKMTLNLEPTAQIFLHPVSRDERFLDGKAFPYNFSLYSGISYRF